MTPEAEFLVGPGSPGPDGLPISPSRFKRGVQAFISPSLVVPGSVDALHIGLLSAARGPAGRLFFVLGLFPLT